MSARACTILLVLLLPLAAVYGQDKKDALELYRNGDYRQAMQVCLEELEEMPNRMDAYAVLGWSLLKLERYQEALDYGQKALAVSRYDPRLIEINGEALFYLGRRREALALFEEYAAIAPTGGRIEVVYFFMGEIFIQEGQYHRADIALSTALYHSPNVASWWARLGYAREKAQDFQWALEAYNKALALNPNQADAGRGKARVEGRLTGG
jgi:tetratricopeptide (TPR) repeat protein